EVDGGRVGHRDGLLDDAEGAASRQVAAHDRGHVLRGAAVAREARDGDRVLGGPDAGDVDAHLRRRREGKEQCAEQREDEMPHGTPREGRSQILYGQRSSRGPRAISSSRGQLPSACLGSGLVLSIPRYAAASQAGKPLDRRSFTESIEQSAPTVTAKTALGLPCRS